MRNSYSFIHFLSITSLIFLISCGENNSNTNPEILDENPIVNISKLSLGSLEIDVAYPLNMGTATSTVRSLSKVISIVNESLTESIPFEIDSPINGFSIKTNRCPEILSPRQKCNLTLQFSARGLYDGTHTSTLLIESDGNQVSIPLSATVSDQPSPISSGVPELSLTMTNNFSGSSNVPYRRLDIQNTGDGITKDIKVILPNSYRVHLDRCKNNLLPQEKCYNLILHKDYRHNNPPVGEVVMRYEHSGDNQVKAKKLDLLGSVEESVVINSIPTYSSIPNNTKTEICSGEESFFQSLLSCKDQFGIDLNTVFCPPPQNVTYTSPAGTIFEELTGGSKTLNCSAGASSPSSLNSFTCEAGRYFTPNNMSGECNQCSAGYYSGINALSCTACGTGQYQDTVGASSCKSCTNKPANASSVVYSSSSALSSNNCPISSVVCVANYHPSSDNKSCVLRHIKNFGSYRGYSDGTVASNCNEYKNGGYYTGDTGNGVYQGPSGQFTCDMTTSSYGYQQVFTLSNTNLLNGRQFVKLVSPTPGAGGAPINNQVVAVFPVSNPTVNGMIGKPTVLTNANYSSCCGGPGGTGYSYLNHDTYFTSNSMNEGIYQGGAVVFSGGLVGYIGTMSDGLPGERSYIYYRQYNYTIWERP